MKWTKHQEEEAKRQWILKKSGTEIGEGLGFTRNAVMGKLGRLGLLGFRRKEQREQNMRRKQTQITKPKIVIVPAPVVALNPDDYKCSINQLKDDKCHWLRGDSLYCGMPTRAGAPYCEDHCKLAYQPVRERKVKEYASAQ